MKTAQSNVTAQLDRSPLWKQKRIRLFGEILALLLFAELALQLSLRKGWAAYKGFDAVEAVAVNRQGQVWTTGYRQAVGGLLKYPEKGRPMEVPVPDVLRRVSRGALMIDGQDRVWLGSDDGIIGMRAVNEQWILFTTNPNYSIWDIVMDGNGQVWAISHDGPGRIDPDSSERTFAFTNSGLAENNAVAITTDKDGQLWVLTEKRELKILEPDGSWTTYTIVPDTVRNAIFGSHLAIDQQGQIWLATSDGVGRLSAGGAWTPYPLGDPARPRSISAIVPNSHGQVWVAVESQGLFLFDPALGWTNYTSRNSGLSSDSVTVLALDRQGYVWAGTASDGLSQFRQDAALPVQILPIVSLAAGVILPAALLIVVLLAGLAIAFPKGFPTSGRKIRDFAIAFAGWFVFNSLLWGSISYSASQWSGFPIISPLVLLPLPLNVLVMIVLYRWRRWMALGAFSAFFINWIVLILAIPLADPSSVGNPPLGIAFFMIPFYFLIF